MGEGKQAFLNVPFDPRFEPLFIAYIVGLTSLGFKPRCVLEVAPSITAWSRLDRIKSLIASCDVSIHDLSRVQLSTGPIRCPRFNMPFELGLAVALSKGNDLWRIFEAKHYRLQHSLSDLNGFDPYIHGGTPLGVLRELRSAFPSRAQQPDVAMLSRVYNRVRELGASLKRRDRAPSLFSAPLFRDIAAASADMAQRLL